MATLYIENHLAKLLGFKGRTVSLVPGVKTAVDAADWSRIWSTDKTAKFYFANRAIEVTNDDGTDWKPPTDVDRLARMPSGMLPPHANIPNEDLNDGDAPEDVVVRSRGDIEPTPMAGVPGNANQSKAAVIACVDVATLDAWGKSETRNTVLNAIAKRRAELTGDGDTIG